MGKEVRLAMVEVLENMAERSDCRRREVANIDFLLLRMEMLEPADRVELEMHYCNNATFGQIAQLAGVSVSTVSRHIQKLTKGLLGNEYITIIRNRRRFSRQELNVAYDHFLLGMGYRSIAVKRRLGTAVVRRIIKQLMLNVGCCPDLSGLN
jgi:DNA-binding transcriptional ArsR family regulator